MRRLWPLLLAGCVAVPAEPDQISFGNGGSITGAGVTTTVSADDRVTVEVSDWTGAEAGNTRTDTIVPGSFARVTAVLAAEGRAVQAALDPDAAACQDYGTDIVKAVPPVAGIGVISAGCFDAAMAGLMNRLSAAVPPP